MRNSYARRYELETSARAAARALLVRPRAWRYAYAYAGMRASEHAPRLQAGGAADDINGSTALLAVADLVADVVTDRSLPAPELSLSADQAGAIAEAMRVLAAHAAAAAAANNSRVVMAMGPAVTAGTAFASLVDMRRLAVAAARFGDAAAVLVRVGRLVNGVTAGFGSGEGGFSLPRNIPAIIADMKEVVALPGDILRGSVDADGGLTLSALATTVTAVSFALNEADLLAGSPAAAQWAALFRAAAAVRASLLPLRLPTVASVAAAAVGDGGAGAFSWTCVPARARMNPFPASLSVCVT